MITMFCQLGQITKPHNLLLIAILSSSISYAHVEDLRGVQSISWKTHQISLTNHFGGQVREVRIGKKNCIISNHLKFNVINNYAYDIDEDVEVYVEFYLDNNVINVEFYYDKNPNLLDPISILLPKKKSRDVHQITLNMERARFAGRHPGQGDFSIAADGGEITVCDITLKRSYKKINSVAYGTLELSILDENDTLVPARVGIYDATGRMPIPAQNTATTSSINRVLTLLPGDVPWPTKNRRALYVDGTYNVELPVGKYEVVVARGPEYRLSTNTFIIEAGRETPISIALSRWTNMKEKGWYSGDVHIHHGQGDEKDSKNIHLQTQAEDLNVSNILQMDNISAIYYKQYKWGKNSHYGKFPYVLVPGQEGPRTLIRGHAIQLNIDEPAWNPERYFLYHEVFEKAHKQGGVTGYAHVGLSDNLGLFPDNLGARPGLALDVPYGLVDFVEVLQYANANTKIWFDFLNLGYKLSPAAGTDYPSLGIPGAVRNYVKINGKYSVRKWFEGLKAGQTFITNGPMLKFSINEREMGSDIHAKKGDVLTIVASAMINPDIDYLDKIQVIQNGEIIAEVTSTKGDEMLSLKHNLQVDHGSWFVLRAQGKQKAPGRNIIALSGPIYVFDDGGGFCKLSAVPSIVEELKDQMQKMLAIPVENQPIISKEDTWDPSLKYWENVKKALRDRVNGANEKYDEIVALAENNICNSVD